MFGYPDIVDIPPILGMNTLSDPVDLVPGECVELVNARPGNPPEIRMGSDTWVLSDTLDFTVIPPAIPIQLVDGSFVILCWAKYEDDYKFLKIDINSRPPKVTVLGTATGLSSPGFFLLRAHGEIYCFCNEDSVLYEGETYMLRHRILQIESDFTLQRPLNITVYPIITSITEAAGTTYPSSSGKYVAYTATYIRRNDSAAFNIYGSPKIMDTALPGAVESIGSALSLQVKLLSGTNKAFILSVYDDQSENRVTAIREGATHIRIFKSAVQDSSDNATAASKYFVVDLPVTIPNQKIPITDIELPSNDLLVNTATVHGLTTLDEVVFSGVGGAVELNAMDRIDVVTVSDTDTFTLDDTDVESFSEYTSGGYVGKGLAIESIDGPQGVHWWTWANGLYANQNGGFTPTTGLVIVKSTAHGLTTGDSVLLKGSGGPFTAKASTSYSYNGGMGGISGEAHAAALGLNGRIFTITKIDDDYFSLDGEDRVNYNAYSTEMAGYIMVDPVEITSMTAPKNSVIIEAVGHQMTDGMYALVSDVAQPTDFNGVQFGVEVVDDDHILLVGTNTSGVAAYTSGGFVQISVEGVQWTDTVTDVMLSVATYTYRADQYAVAPNAEFTEFFKNRMWLFGVVGQSQKAYFSESIGGDTGTPLDDAIAFPQKYSSWYRNDYSVTCVSEAGIVATGMASLIDDLYFFFEEKIFVLFGGDPEYSKPVAVGEDIGCLFPYTICRANIPYFGGVCLLFISNKGPAVIKNGGEIQLVTEFRIKELWPSDSTDLTSGEIFKDFRTSETTRAWIKKNCTSAFWKETWTVIYRTYAGTNRIWECYFDPDLKKDSNAPHGAYQTEMAEI